MQVREAMTGQCEFIEPDASLQEAAQRMRDLDCGFLAIGPASDNKLEGVITDRDIVTRCVADGKDPSRTSVKSAETHRVLYCFETDGLDKAAESMRDMQVYRLIVLDNPDNKQLRGVISWGDIVRHNERKLALKAAEGISRAA